MKGGLVEFKGFVEYRLDVSFNVSQSVTHESGKKKIFFSSHTYKNTKLGKGKN